MLTPGVGRFAIAFRPPHCRILNNVLVLKLTVSNRVCICLTSLTRAKPKEKWNFPLNFRTAAYPELLLKGPSFHVTE